MTSANFQHSSKQCEPEKVCNVITQNTRVDVEGLWHSEISFHGGKNEMLENGMLSAAQSRTEISQQSACLFTV